MRDVEFHFKGRNYAVAGASSGMGRQIAMDLGRTGANVLAIARNEERLESLRKQFPDQIETVSLDVLSSDLEAWEKVCAAFVDGHGKFDGGVYTAGISGISPLRRYDQELANRIVDTSFWGMVHFIQLMTRKKHVKKGASFVVFSSTAAYCGNKGYFAYSAAKAAVQSAVRSFAKELSRDRHRINSISPGWVDTEMSRKGREEIGPEGVERIFQSHLLGTGNPENVSGTVLFLLSDEAQWITGTDIVVDGGSLLGMN